MPRGVEIIDLLNNKKNIMDKLRNVMLRNVLLHNIMIGEQCIVATMFYAMHVRFTFYTSGWTSEGYKGVMIYCPYF